VVPEPNRRIGELDGFVLVVDGMIAFEIIFLTEMERE
jgi:hypothetical protein